MSDNKEQIVNSRIAKSEEAIKMAELAAENNFWNSTASELYYLFLLNNGSLCQA